MTARVATCRCGRLRITCSGEPVRVSVCHCLACQKRTGSAFGVQARWPDSHIELVGEYRNWSRTTDSGNRTTYLFCPDCGSTLAFTNDAMPGVTAIAVGAFADPTFPAPFVSVYEERKHNWVAVTGAQVEHID